MDFSPDANKEFLWCAKLDSKTKFHQWEGRDDAASEQIVLKRACLAATAKEKERNIVEVTSFNHKQQKVEACICSLRSGLKEDENLSDLTILPPAIFKLIAGSGPVHIVGNHMIIEDFEEGSDDDELSDDMNDPQMAEDDSEDEEDEEEEDEEEETSRLKQELARLEAEEESDEEDADDEDDDDEKEASSVKKRKGEDVSVPKKKKAKKDENAKPSKMNGASQKKSEKTPKKQAAATPLQQKQNKTPLSNKKTAKTYSSISDLIAAIKKYPGGKPKKEEKFANWVKNTFRVDNHEWVKQLWKSHKADMGL